MAQSRRASAPKERVFTPSDYEGRNCGMNAKKIVELRREAEKAVAEMPDGELKVKAFEVILNHLLAGPDVVTVRTGEGEKEAKPKGGKEKVTATSIGGRILVL